MKLSLSGFIQSHTGATHGLLVGLVALAGGSQLPMGQTILHTITTNHPRIAPLITLCVGAGFLLLNPNVDAKIKTMTGIDLTADQAKLQQTKENITQVQQDLAQARAQAAQATGQPPTTPPSGPAKG